MGIDFPFPRKTLILKFPSSGTAKVPSAQEMNDEASIWDIWPINWIISNVSKSPNTKVCRPFVLRYENVSCTIHNMYTITLGCAVSSLFKTEWYTWSMQCPTYQEENQAFPLILEHSFWDENSIINMSRFALAFFPGNGDGKGEMVWLENISFCTFDIFIPFSHAFILTLLSSLVKIK